MTLGATPNHQFHRTVNGGAALAVGSRRTESLGVI